MAKVSPSAQHPTKGAVASRKPGQAVPSKGGAAPSGAQPTQPPGASTQKGMTPTVKKGQGKVQPTQTPPTSRPAPARPAARPIPGDD